MAAMKMKTFLLVSILVTPIVWAQTAPRQAPDSHPDRDRLASGQCQEMMEMHKQQIEAMRAEVEHLRKSLAQMKANLLTIRDSNEMDRWRNNAEMWQALVDHMDRMLKEMELSQVGTTGPCVGGLPSAAPIKKKPE
jgi:hypothetical protein